MDDTQSHLPDNLVVNHFDGREERVSLPPSETPIRIGRETDNDVVLSDPRASRYHAQVRRGEEGLEIMDVGSASARNASKPIAGSHYRLARSPTWAIRRSPSNQALHQHIRWQWPR
jgi:hypothetical protein